MSDSLQAQGVVVTIDYGSLTAEVCFPNGVEVVLPWRADRLEESSAIRRMTYEVGGTHVRFETWAGDELVADLPRPDNLAPIDGRPIVYLDQNHWSTLAWTIHRPATVALRERLAAERIIDLAERRRVILPMSSGHMGETCQWRDHASRYQLALTILRLSRGWQMRDPLGLRNLELRQALITRFGENPLPPVVPFTLEPNAVHASPDKESALVGDLPPLLAFSVEALASVSSNFDVMLDSEPVFPLPVPGWAQNLQRLNDWLAAEPRDRRQRRERTRVIFLADMPHELAAAAHQVGLSEIQLREWLDGWTDEAIAELPSLGIFRELMHEKLLDPRTTWEGNDLVDMMYLSCATAYADHVAGERRLTSHLRSALRRLDRPARVYRCLHDLVPALSGL